MNFFRKKDSLRAVLVLILLGGSGLTICARTPVEADSLKGVSLFQNAKEETDQDCRVELYRQASLHFRAADQPVLWWNCLDNICWELFKKERDDETFAWLDTAVKEVWWPEDQKTATIYANRGYYRKQTKDYYLAKKDYERALQITRNHTTLDCRHGYTLMKSLANLYTQFGEYEKARLLLESALKLCDDYPDLSKKAALMSDLAMVYRFENNPEAALNLYDQALLFQSTDNNTQGLLLINKADALSLLGENEQSLPLVLKGIKEINAAPKPNLRYLESAYAILGSVYEQLGKKSEALNFFYRALDISGKMYGGKPGREAGKIYKALGEIALTEGKYTEAEDFFYSALKTVLPENETTTLQNPGHMADNVLMEALEGMGTVAWTAWKQNPDQNLLKNAYTHYTQSIRVQDALRAEYIYESSSFKLQEESIRRHEYAIATAFELYQATGEPSWLDSAFSFFEKSKSVVLKESLSEIEAGKASAIPQPLLDRRNDLENARIFFERQIFEEKQKADTADQKMIGFWENRLSELQVSLDSVESHLKSQYANWYQLKDLASRRHISEVQPWLAGKDAQMIQYFWGESSLYILAIDAKGIRSNTLRLDSVNLAVKIDSLRLILGDYQQTEDEALAAVYYHAYVRLAYKLYNLLLAPVLPESKTNRTRPGKMIIIPDGLLGYLPFDVLLTASAEGKSGFRTLDYVLNDYIVSYGYSAGLSMVKNPQNNAASVVLGGYAPSYGEGWFSEARRSFRLNDLRAFNNLKYNQPEVESIIRVVGGEAFMGKDATEAAFRSSAGRYRILHLSMHGFTNEEDPLYSGLVFSYGNGMEAVSDQQNARSQTPESFSQVERNTGKGQNDGFLHTYEIFTLNLQAEMAVLSACKTGLGKLIRGEGIMSLARAFRAAGCPAVVMSLWEADDQSTREIMEKFYANVKEGQSKDEALHNAKSEYLQSAASNRINPLYWSTFVMIGDDTPVFREDYTWLFFLVGGGLILGILGLAIFLNHRKPQEQI